MLAFTVFQMLKFLRVSQSVNLFGPFNSYQYDSVPELDSLPVRKERTTKGSFVELRRTREQKTNG